MYKQCIIVDIIYKNLTNYVRDCYERHDGLTRSEDRRLATGNVQRVCSATYQIFFNIFRLSIPNPNPEP